MAKTAVPKIHVQLSAGELEAVITLTEDQLFRVKFIDPKMPGHKTYPEQIRAAESALHALRAQVTNTHTRYPFKKFGPSVVKLAKT